MYINLSEASRSPTVGKSVWLCLTWGGGCLTFPNTVIFINVALYIEEIAKNNKVEMGKIIFKLCRSIQRSISYDDHNHKVLYSLQNTYIYAISFYSYKYLRN